MRFARFRARRRPTGQSKGVKANDQKLKVRNRFYIAASLVTSASEQDQDNTSDKAHLALRSGDRSGKWTRKTVKDAVAHAEQILADEPGKDHVAIVQIVKIVRRKAAPIIVENVRG